MRHWKKSSPELIERFSKALPDDPRVERRQMFGYPCAFVNGNMFTGLHEENLLVRLGEAQRAMLLAERGARLFEPMPGRRMREYVVVPPPLVAKNDVLERWVGEAFRYVLGLPAKAKKTPARPRATTAKPTRAPRVRRSR